MKKEIITTIDVESRMIEVRGQYVLLDRDVAELYGVETKCINQAVARNPEKFPKGFVLELDNQESTVLRSQIVTLKPGQGSGKNISKYNYKAFTEKGLYMLATVLHSKQATATTIAIIETFTRVRHLARTMENVSQVQDGGEQQQNLLQRTGEILADVVGKNLSTTSCETEIELNFALVKIKHKFTRKEEGEDK